MSEDTTFDQRFGDIAIEQNLITKDKLDRGLVIQRCIFTRTKVHMPIGQVLKKMGLMNDAHIDSVLEAEKAGTEKSAEDGQTDAPNESANSLDSIELTVSKDKLEAFLAPTGESQNGLDLDVVKRLLAENNIVHGVVHDKVLGAYLAQTPLPGEPFLVARGTAPVPGQPPEIQYLFDTDPMRIGTLKADGTMDWKDRGDIPQVADGDVLAEKVGGFPGEPGTSIFGEELSPPRVKDPKIKCSKGAQRSKDGNQAVAKFGGTPKLESDGRVGVQGMLRIDGDIGVETGNVAFDGYIEAEGAVCGGYEVKGGGLGAKEIQNAKVEVSGDVVCSGGIYGATLKVGGNLKASHLHNCTVEVIGELAVEKEIFGCNIEINGRCIVDSGKIISSKIGAKKGIQVKDVGTEAAKPSELIVGVDHKAEREIKALKIELDQMEKQLASKVETIGLLKGQIDELDAELGQVAQEQDGHMVQKRRLEDKLSGPNPEKNEDKRNLLNELISDLAKKYDELDQRVQAIMSQDDLIRGQIANHEKEHAELEEQFNENKENMSILEESAKVDPGLPVVKVNGTVYGKTLVSGPHKKLVIPKTMRSVRIAEAQEAPNQFQIKISSLR